MTARERGLGDELTFDSVDLEDIMTSSFTVGAPGLGASVMQEGREGCMQGVRTFCAKLVGIRSFYST